MLSLLAAAALCFVQKDKPPLCQSTIAIAPVEVERTFVRTSEEAKRVVVGVVPAKAEAVKLEGDEYRDVTLTLSSLADVRITIDERDVRSWSWVVPRKRIAALATVAVPRGRYTFSFAADHYATAVRRIDVQKNTSVREVALKPLPILSARIVSTKQEPIAGARLTANDRLIATSDEQGNARGELAEPLPDSVIVEKSGCGSTTVPLTTTDADINLGTIRLGAGRKLSLHITRPNAMEVKVRVERKNEFKYENAPVTTKTLAKGDEHLVLDDLGAGTYFVEVSGSEALEKMTADVDLAESDLAKEIAIEPFRLDGSARIGDDPIDGQIEVQDRLHVLPVPIPIRGGRFGGMTWQRGKIGGFVEGANLQPGQWVDAPDLGADPTAWNIVFPKRFITGRRRKHVFARSGGR